MPWGQEPTTVDVLLWPAFLALFLILVIVVLVKRLSLDRCLKLLRKHHVTVLTEKRGTVWGDLLVRTKGAEVVFDQLYESPSGSIKSSVLLYDDEMNRAVAVCRIEQGLTEDERAQRLEQIRRTFEPSIWRRAFRWLRNAIAMIRDAVTQSMGMFIGRLTPHGIIGATVKEHREDISDRVSELIANTYEPVLEPHIGQRVILEIAAPQGAPTKCFELPGYLVDYTAKYIAVFNTDHHPEETLSLELPCDPELAHEAGLSIDEGDTSTVLTCRGPLASVIVCAEIPGDTLHLAVVLLPGASVSLPSWPRPVRLTVHETRLFDVVCPRSRARVRNASAEAPTNLRWRGVAPMDPPEPPS